MVKEISKSFEIQDLGKPAQLLGIKIDRDYTKNIIHISQPVFIHTIAKRFNIQPGRTISNPMNPSIDLRLSSDANTTMDIPYASLIGCINYCAVSTRPDIAFSTNKCAQFISHPTITHWNTLKRVIRYLIHTKNHGIIYKHGGNGMEGYPHNLARLTDADFVGDKNRSQINHRMGIHVQ